MTSADRWIVLVGRLAPAVLLFGLPAVAIGAPDLSVFAASPAYTVVTNCDLAQPLAFMNLMVANRSSEPSSSMSVGALDAAGVLAGVATTLPPIAPGAQTALRIPLRYVPSSTGSIGGPHSVTIVLGLRREHPIPVLIPATLCITPSPVISQRSRIFVLSTPPPGVSQVVQSQTGAAKVLLETRTLAAPSGVRIASGAADCVGHIGLVGALLCPDMIRSGNMLLVWDWQPGVGPDQIDGFRMYRVDGKKRLIDTRPTKRDVTLVDVAVPPGGYPGTCYAASAFAGTTESVLSPAFCPTRQQTIVGAMPSVGPAPAPTRAPRHVDIHVTADSFPMDTVVAAGGDVTWINDDTDEHSVYGSGGSFSGDLYPNGGRYTTTFRNIDNKPYWVSYLCEYHQDMIGKILVVP